MKTNNILMAIVLVVVYNSLVYADVKNNKSVEIEKVIEAHDFIQEYKLQQIRADLKYYGSNILMKGVCDKFAILIDIRYGEFRDPKYDYVPFIEIYYEHGDPWKGAVNCYFSNDQKSKIAQYDVGSEIKFTGTVYKSNGPYIYIVDCKIVE